MKVFYTSTCVEGGSSPDNGNYDISGCFDATSDLFIDDGDGSFPVTVTPTAVTNTYRTIQGFSTGAAAKMTGQEYYGYFKSLYGKGDYGDLFTKKALDTPEASSNSKVGIRKTLF